jgi:hypothetical protein
MKNYLKDKYIGMTFGSPDAIYSEQGNSTADTYDVFPDIDGLDTEVSRRYVNAVARIKLALRRAADEIARLGGDPYDTIIARAAAPYRSTE